LFLLYLLLQEETYFALLHMYKISVTFTTCSRGTEQHPPLPTRGCQELELDSSQQGTPGR